MNFLSDLGLLLSCLTLRRVLVLTFLVALVLAVPGSMDPAAFKLGFFYAVETVRECLLRENRPELKPEESLMLHQHFAGFIGFMCGVFVLFFSVPSLLLLGLWFWRRSIARAAHYLRRRGWIP